MFNTSEIPMQFSWRVLNGDLPESEFNIIPSTGAILPGMRQKVLVEFTPRNVARYNSQIILDIPKVRSAAATIAATGESVVPRLVLSHEVLDYGHCFLNHPYTLGLVISNTAKLPVKFEIEPQDDVSVALAGFSASPSNGGIPAQGVSYHSSPKITWISIINYSVSDCAKFTFISIISYYVSDCAIESHCAHSLQASRL